MDLNSSRKTEKRNKLDKIYMFWQIKGKSSTKQICGLLAFSQFWITWWCILFIHCCRDVCVCTFSHFSTQNVIIGQTWFILIGNRSKLEMSTSFQYLTGYKVKKYLKMLWPMWRFWGFFGLKCIFHLIFSASCLDVMFYHCQKVAVILQS